MIEPYLPPAVGRTHSDCAGQFHFLVPDKLRDFPKIHLVKGDVRDAPAVMSAIQGWGWSSNSRLQLGINAPSIFLSTTLM